MRDKNNLNSNPNKRLTFSLAISIVALGLTFFDNSVLNNGILGVCVFVSTHSIMKLQKK